MRPQESSWRRKMKQGSRLVRSLAKLVEMVVCLSVRLSFYSLGGIMAARRVGRLPTVSALWGLWQAFRFFLR